MYPIFKNKYGLTESFQHLTYMFISLKTIFVNVFQKYFEIEDRKMEMKIFILTMLENRKDSYWDVMLEDAVRACHP